MRPLKIISGGQTGVDRAALDVAIELGIPHGGFCTKGRRAEDGRIPDRYQLTEMPTTAYPPRTERNAKESSATLILYDGRHLPITPGTLLTQDICMRIKPTQPQGWAWYMLNLHPDARAERALGYWLARVDLACLNIAGPRESKAPGIYETTRRLLLEMFR